MNALHLPYLAIDRMADYRRQADQSRIAAPSRTMPAAHDPEPRIPRRGALHVVSSLRSFVRWVVA